MRGRILDGARPAAGATVAVAKAHRSAMVGADGTFEIRLPPGTWMVGFRRAVGAGLPEPRPAELKVAVTAGGTVDVGTVQLAGPQDRPAAARTRPRDPLP